MPDTLLEAQALFRDFYHRTKEGRNISWYHALSSCTIRTDFYKAPDGRGFGTEITASLY